MEKLETLKRVTLTHSFQIEVLRDGESGECVGKINGQTQRVFAATAYPRGVNTSQGIVQNIGPIEVRESSRDRLIEECERHIREIGGRIQESQL